MPETTNERSLSTTPSRRDHLVEQPEVEHRLPPVGAIPHLEADAVQRRNHEVDTAIDGTFVVIPAGAALIPEQAPVETGHQLNPVEEVDTPDTRGTALQQNEAFLEREQGLVDPERARIGARKSCRRAHP